MEFFDLVADRFGLCAVCGRREACCDLCHRAHDYVNAPRPLATHCGRGHEWTPENTYIYSKTKRQCRACAAMTHAERRAS